ncbi:Protein of uncharacterised function (DUF2591) [Serratia entomophila]|uniref:DUF2591 domain-containing protein n=1 Tax=Serratia entomophila TaxID=42906 RepID=UPI002178199A|nr:DUF2591 domain-containing protein [Serratia entomophila]CAI0803568.1 Protein of uncharacterised function (DUF2591) [Serratia entomophila]
MTDYSKMSDFEIDKAVAEITGDSKPTVEEWGISRIIPDYCNNPADAWPIIVANEIGVVPSKSSNTYAWDLRGGMLKGIKHVDDNPLRAAMIVFLMMKDAEKC